MNTTRDATAVVTRQLDGKPETVAEARFFALRESGYTGPVDQDGHRVDDVDTWIAQRLSTTGGLTGGPLGG